MMGADGPEGAHVAASRDIQNPGFFCSLADSQATSAPAAEGELPS